MDEFRILFNHSFRKVSVNGGGFKQADMQRRLSDTASLIQPPTHHLTFTKMIYMYNDRIRQSDVKNNF